MLKALSAQSKLFDNVFNKGDPDNVAQRLVDRETTFSQEVQQIKKKANKEDKEGGRRTRRRKRKRRKRRSRRGGNPTLEECKKAFPNMIWRGKKPRPRVAPPRIQKKKMNPELAKKLVQKQRLLAWGVTGNVDPEDTSTLGRRRDPIGQAREPGKRRWQRGWR